MFTYNINKRKQLKRDEYFSVSLSSDSGSWAVLFNSCSCVCVARSAMTDGCQLFLSKRLVTETKIFDGGVLVDDRGVIVDVLDRNEAEKLITERRGKLKVSYTYCVVLFTNTFLNAVSRTFPAVVVTTLRGR